MLVLAIDTSADALSLAVGDRSRVLERSVVTGQRQAELILGAIAALLAEARVRLTDIGGIAFGAGPGSFTGLRIACGVAQGLALARSIPVLGVSTLAALAETCGAPRVVACLDARMGEVYHAAFERVGADLRELEAPGLYRPREIPRPASGEWTGCGSGFAVHHDELATCLGPHLVEVKPDLTASAAAIIRLAEPRFARGEGKDAADAAPLYVRDKVALKTSER